MIAGAFGGPEVLSVVEEPVPDPGPGEARIEVRAAGVNPVDVKSYSGAFGTDPSRLPIRLGAEAAGMVTAIGPDTAGPAGPVRVGDEVIAYRAPGADPGSEIRQRARLDLARLAQDGKLRVLVSQTFPLADAAAAHRVILDGHTAGKIALSP